MTAMRTLPPPVVHHPSATPPQTAAMALAVAAGAHLAAFPAHRSGGVAVGGFFLVAAALQLAAAMRIFRGSGVRLRRAVVVGNGVLITLWVWSRAAGVPFGAHPGVAEPVGVLDVVAVGAQVLSVLTIVLVPRGRAHASLVLSRSALVGVALVLAVSGGVLFPGDHGSEHQEPTGDHAPPHEHYGTHAHP